MRQERKVRKAQEPVSAAVAHALLHGQVQPGARFEAATPAHSPGGEVACALEDAGRAQGGFLRRHEVGEDVGDHAAVERRTQAATDLQLSLGR